MEWFEEFLRLYFRVGIEEAYKFKHKIYRRNCININLIKKTGYRLL